MHKPHEKDESSFGSCRCDEEPQKYEALETGATSINFSDDNAKVDSPDWSDRSDLERQGLKERNTLISTVKLSSAE